MLIVGVDVVRDFDKVLRDWGEGRGMFDWEGGGVVVNKDVES